MKIRLDNVRLAFADLFEAKDFEGQGNPRFGASLLFEPGSANESKVRRAIEGAAKEKWADKGKAMLKQLSATDKLCLHDGAFKDYDGFEGMMYVNANNTVRPKILDRNRQLLDSSDGKPYSGCYVNAVIDIWAQDNQWGKRISAQLLGVQFYRDGDAFSGGATASEDDFDELDEDSGFSDSDIPL